MGVERDVPVMIRCEPSVGNAVSGSSYQERSGSMPASRADMPQDFQHLPVKRIILQDFLNQLFGKISGTGRLDPPSAPRGTTRGSQPPQFKRDRAAREGRRAVGTGSLTGGPHSGMFSKKCVKRCPNRVLPLTSTREICSVMDCLSQSL